MVSYLFREVSIPHMGCMPYGLDPVGVTIDHLLVSIPHMGCMPYGPLRLRLHTENPKSFNPSYGLHALRAVLKLIRTLQV